MHPTIKAGLLLILSVCLIASAEPAFLVTSPAKGAIIASNGTDWRSLWSDLPMPPENLCWVADEHRFYFSSDDTVYWADPNYPGTQLTSMKAAGHVLGLCGDFKTLVVITEGLVTVYYKYWTSKYAFNITGEWAGLTACSIVDESTVALVGEKLVGGVALLKWETGMFTKLPAPYNTHGATFISVKKGVAVVTTFFSGNWYITRGLLRNFVSPTTEWFLLGSSTPVGVGLSSSPSRDIYVAQTTGIVKLVEGSSSSYWIAILKLVPGGLAVL